MIKKFDCIVVTAEDALMVAIQTTKIMNVATVGTCKLELSHLILDSPIERSCIAKLLKECLMDISQRRTKFQMILDLRINGMDLGRRVQHQGHNSLVPPLDDIVVRSD
jgi:hypothetical protein